ncbi:MAG: class I SAM-dependent methyltransferase [Kordiimonadaceae bacterium]|jgi:2-polyprenyl-3-methyl-5-hydroxy-6-metoxy-1,4-benzoquinol methylase|nr:class I SAM-dependent methyltransferase [Kordiimonadaceae bacterium]MBT6035336.1 class I SAM-dependent methyltransferase [Kordiimonadaceae bacterium]MBT6328497.1 class I SAM-dependent methyltransferase [Kordiimonadaceae bacterium]MBT7581955.1 class I SAM-dependent methyltransferase [Kordiimonadaceae bacterium]
MTTQPDEQQLIDQQKEHFNSIASEYKNARSHKNHLLLKELIWHHCLKNINLAKNKKYQLLEAMCGFAEGGKLASRHLGVEIDYEGFDYSDSVINDLKTSEPDISVWQADATKWLPETGKYDIIVLIGGLHHVPNQAETVINNLSKGLKAGGIFINFEPTYANPLTKWVRKKIYQKNPLFDEQTERDFSVKELKSFFNAASLNPLKLRYPGLASYVLFYNPDAFPFLNKGGEWLVRATFFIDRVFYAFKIGEWFSFATFSVWKKPESDL